MLNVLNIPLRCKICMYGWMHVQTYVYFTGSIFESNCLIKALHVYLNDVYGNEDLERMNSGNYML